MRFGGGDLGATILEPACLRFFGDDDDDDDDKELEE